MLARLIGLRAAVGFLTRVPIGAHPLPAPALRAAVGWFPLVGSLVGVATATVLALLAPLGASAGLFAIGAALLLTGAFHEDGLADTADALGGGFDRGRVLEILKDSRIGAFGASALIVSIGGRATLLSSLAGQPAAHLVAAMATTGALARLAAVAVMLALPYARPDGASKSRDLTDVGPGEAICAIASTLAVLVAAQAAGLSWARLGAAAGLCALVALVSGWRYRVRVGGYTGDFLGATEQLAELACLSTFIWGAA